MEENLKKTNQRTLVVEYLKSVRTHPTAEKVYEEVRKTLPHIGLATVYRNLKILSKRGEILEVETSGASRFDADTSLHQHFICEKCGDVMDVFIKGLTEKSIVAMKNKRNFFVRTAKIDFYGLCERCKNKPIKGNYRL